MFTSSGISGCMVAYAATSTRAMRTASAAQHYTVIIVHVLQTLLHAGSWLGTAVQGCRRSGQSCAAVWDRHGHEVRTQASFTRLDSSMLTCGSAAHLHCCASGLQKHSNMAGT